MTLPKLSNENEIVLVDDDVAEALIAGCFLEQSGLKNPFLAFQGGEAFFQYMEEVKAQKKRMPALVLLDIRMPLLDGFEVLARLREDATFKNEPCVIMFSNSDATTDIQNSLKGGANGYKTKPRSPAEFVDFFVSLAPGPKAA